MRTKEVGGPAFKIRSELGMRLKTKTIFFRADIK